jgi:hypothetical protein
MTNALPALRHRFNNEDNSSNDSITVELDREQGPVSLTIAVPGLRSQQMSDRDIVHRQVLAALGAVLTALSSP